MLVNKYSFLILPFFLFISFQFILSNIKILQTPAQDFEYFYTAGKKVLQEGNPYIERAGGLIRNPPPTMLLYALLPLFPIYLAQVIFYIISFIAFIAGSYFLFKILKEEVNTQTWLLYLSLVLVFFPFRHTLGSGQLNNLLFLLFTSTIYLLEVKGKSSAVIPLAINIAIKITPIFILFVFLIQKRTKEILLTFFTILVLLMITFLFFGQNLFKNYLVIPNSYFDFGASSYYNQSLGGFLARSLNNPNFSSIILLFILFWGIFLITYLVTLTYKKKYYFNLIIWNISILYILIFSPFAWQHYFTLSIIPLVITFYLGIKLKLTRRFLILTAISYLLLGWNIKDPQSIQKIGLIGSIIISHVLWGAFLLLSLNFYLIKKLIKV